MQMRGDGSLHSSTPSSITTRFILLSEPRSGSTLLVDELSRRWPEIRARREVFNPKRRDDTQQFEDIARQTFFDDTGRRIVGCKIFGSQVSAEQLALLLTLPNMRVIVLRRRNQLRQHVSEEIARHTDRWMQSTSGESIELPASERSVTIDVARFSKSRAWSRTTFRAFEVLTEGLPRIDVWYEDLAEDLDAELRRIASFLGAGAPRTESTPQLTRQNPEPLRDLITNYEEVSAELHRLGLQALLTLGEQERAPEITTRFIVFAEGRTGSTLLVSELDRRWPEIRAKWEVYHEGPRKAEAFAEITRSTFFEATGETIVGCKIFPGQLSEEEWRTVLAIEGLHVIVLRRRDLLRRFISECIAKRTRLWRQPSGTPESALPLEERRIVLEPDALLAATSSSLATFRFFDQITADLPRIDVWYEDLADDLDGELCRVASFLGAGGPTFEATPVLSKQNPESLQDLIVNLDEISAFLDEAGLSEFLHEGQVRQQDADEPTRVSSWPTSEQQLLLRAILAEDAAFDEHWRAWLTCTPVWSCADRLRGLHAVVQPRLQSSVAPAARLHDFRRESVASIAMGIRLLESTREIAGAASEAGIEIVLLGSTALATMAGGNHSTRSRALPLTGIDLATDPHHRDRLFSMLRSRGWVVTDQGTSSITLHLDDLELRVHSTIVRSTTETTIETDLRTGLVPDPSISETTMIPAPAELLFTTIIDGLLTRPAGSMTWILDAHHLITTADDLDWNRIVELCVTHHCGAPVVAALQLLDTLSDDQRRPELHRTLGMIPVTDRQRADFDEAMCLP